jgi:hypothetical protein
MKERGVFYFGKFVVLGMAGLALFTYVVLLLWNWLVPELFSGPELTYWQTLGVLVLAKILFSGIGPGHRKRVPYNGDKREYWSHWSPRHRDYWRKKFEEKMNGKSGEEKPVEDDEDN